MAVWQRSLGPVEWGREILRWALFRRVPRIAGQIALLVAVFQAGSALTSGLHLPVPGNLVGMLLLLSLLVVKVLRPAHLDEVGGFALRHLVFFFVPLAVGVMTWGDLIARSGLVLGASLIVSAAVGVAVAGLIAQRLCRGEDGSRGV